ncbi:hypothetical protein CDD83_10105 [Cordyceps sp. RAO-2017]|nr:hypothetical protein CDD83_10105 [Cordyceps sp. RAO-2017]
MPPPPYIVNNYGPQYGFHSGTNKNGRRPAMPPGHGPDGAPGFIDNSSGKEWIDNRGANGGMYVGGDLLDKGATSIGTDNRGHNGNYNDSRGQKSGYSDSRGSHSPEFSSSDWRGEQSGKSSGGDIARVPFEYVDRSDPVSDEEDRGRTRRVATAPETPARPAEEGKTEVVDSPPEQKDTARQ